MEETRERIFYHALAVHLQSNYRALAALRERHARWEDAWQEVQKNAGAEKLPDPEALYAELATQGITLVLREEGAYPPRLREIPLSPFGIYYKSALQESTYPVAVVGTRRASPSGIKFAHTLAADLARAGCTIISGLAFGIDAAAHEGALHAKGRTIAVLANGLNTVYPRSHASLAERILSAKGTLISEYPPGTPPLPHRLLERNRIVSGLSLGVAVVEVPLGSGARATTRFAIEQNREVFVVPGPVGNPNFEWSHELIRQGAELVTSAKHICESLGIAPTEGSAITTSPKTPEEQVICTTLASAHSPLHVDKIIELTTLNPHTVNKTLTYLLLRGVVREEGEGYALIRNA